MTPARLLFATTASAVLLSACFPRTTDDGSGGAAEIIPAEVGVTAPEADGQAEVVEDVSLTKQAIIDWTAAREDFANREVADEDDTFGVASGSAAPAVPVLLPSRPVTTASANGQPSFKVVPISDGYYAVFRGETYDMVINGSDRLVEAPAGLSGIDPESLRFEETMEGAQVAFSRYGASYLVEFTCKGRAPGPDENCISEENALSEVEELLIAGTR